MGYLHIENLYKNQTILLFRECYALEKIHGTIAHVAFQGGTVRLFSGGEKHERFVDLFDQESILHSFAAMGHDTITVYGEAYGGKQQGQSHRYGKQLRFAVFDVKIGDTWLEVPNAADVAEKLGLEFVHWVRVSTDVAALDAERDADSEQAKRNGIDEPKKREGVVLRPLMELVDKRGNRIIAKHKTAEFSETKTPRDVSPERLAVLTDAESVALEWVTDMRLQHVTDKLNTPGIEQMRDVIRAMTEDVKREGDGEIVWSKDVEKAIGKRTAGLFKQSLHSSIEAT